MNEDDIGDSTSSRHESHPQNSYRRQMLLNHVLLVEAAHQQGQTEAYEELKRLIIFAGIFFLFMIIFVLLKFQVSLDDVFKWSPVVWLVGVIICGLLMNIFLQTKKFIKRRRAKRLREQQNLLYSLNLPSSFPCLAPPPHETCCQCMTLIQNSPGESLTNSNRRALSSSNSSLITINPVIIPSYEQVMRGAKTFLLSKSAFPSTSASTGSGRRPLPPTYSTINIPAELSPPEDRPCSSRALANVPPPAYDESDNSQSLANSHSPTSSNHPSRTGVNTNSSSDVQML
ncbi:hypothetical protein DdX_03181 [Ditylenchus destructor]|uniref:Uncharacterized protein n=1 Tax=Ditylenchus destructor TaxID=166010 RepID=A0AAD4NHH5_9BILA|nr:hypothetical protein DdX_03181 [Ditylenchus destructor]